MVISGIPPLSVTVGSPALGAFLVPSGPSSGTATRSTTKTRVSPISTPICGLPPAAVVAVRTGHGDQHPAPLVLSDQALLESGDHLGQVERGGRAPTEGVVEHLAGARVVPGVVHLDALSGLDRRALGIGLEHLGPGLVDRPRGVDGDLRGLANVTGHLDLVEIARRLDRLGRLARARRSGTAWGGRRSGGGRRGRRVAGIVLAAGTEQQRGAEPEDDHGHSLRGTHRRTLQGVASGSLGREPRRPRRCTQILALYPGTSWVQRGFPRIRGKPTGTGAVRGVRCRACSRSAGRRGRRWIGRGPCRGRCAAPGRSASGGPSRRCSRCGPPGRRG